MDPPLRLFQTSHMALLIHGGPCNNEREQTNETNKQPRHETLTHLMIYVTN